MKTLAVILPILFVVNLSQAQTRKVTEDKLKGIWKLVIDIDKDEVADEIQEEDGVFARLFVKSVLGFVDGVLDEVDIRFEFKSNNRLKVTVNALGEEETEYSEWYINKKGRLILKDTDSFKSDDDYWLFEGDVLVSYDDGSDQPEENVYLINMN